MCNFGIALGKLKLLKMKEEMCLDVSQTETELEESQYEIKSVEG